LIKDTKLWADWEAQYAARQPADFERNLRLLDSLYSHARRLGALPPRNPLEGLETKITLARVLNVLTAA
jgi:hypothetical protein